MQIVIKLSNQTVLWCFLIMCKIRRWLIYVDSGAIITGFDLYNSLRPGDLYERHWTGSSFGQIMTCCQFSAKPLSKPMLTYCQKDPNEHNFIEVKLIWNSKVFIEENGSEIVYIFLAILSWPQCDQVWCHYNSVHYITWYCIPHCHEVGHKSGFELTKDIPIAFPHRWAMGCQLWGFGRKLTCIRAPQCTNISLWLSYI